MNLTSEQQAAVNHQLAHARIVAVAGAGKTATLTHYIAKRFSAATPPKILVLMYNRAAQETFRQRLHRLFAERNSGHFPNPPPDQTLPQVRTFHALGLSIYQRMIGAGWLASRSLQPMSETAIELQLKLWLQNNPKAQALIEGPEQLQEWLDAGRQFITLVKSDIHPATEVMKKLKRERGDELLLEMFNGFELWRQQHQQITYDDMLYDPARVLLEQPQSRQLITESFDEILVDEYQDVNPIQHFLLQVLAGKRAQVMVIGDPDQTIYEFRGSSPQFITQDFARDFVAPTTYCLTRTFRFGHTLALCANQLIHHNRGREPILTVSAAATPQTKVNLAQCEQHGQKIASAIEHLHRQGGAYSGMAVLCRLWSYARPVELELMARAIPYRIDGEQSILQCAEIRPFLSALDLVSGAFFERDLGQKQQALYELLTGASLKIPHALLRQLSVQWAKVIAPGKLQTSFLQAFPSSLSPYQKRSLTLFADALASLTQKQPCATALQQYSRVLELPKRLRDGALNPEKGEEQARTVTAFLQFLAASPQQTAAEMSLRLQQMQNQESNASDAVTITTIHRSKGLEWPAVFIPNVAEGHLPCNPSNTRSAEPNQIESERRLMYVAITRAQKQLFITVPTPQCSGRTSRFVDEMNIPLSQEIGAALYAGHEQLELDSTPSPSVRDYLKQLGEPLALTVRASSPTSARQSEKDYWCVGDRVEHAILGLGQIQQLDQHRVHIRFDDGKTRAFISDLARPHLALAN
jgi:DNA helicase II / ATP-dependent DNA helicase PcrA